MEESIRGDAGEVALLLIMGVSGSGKSTVGSLLARALGWRFVDGDSFHPAANVAKMRAGVALTEEDRRPWLRSIAAWIDATRATGGCGIVACSALKRRYRRRLIGNRSDVRLVYLRADPELIRQRLSARQGHFMPPALLASQFAALEEPAPDEKAVVVAAAAAPATIAAEVIQRLGLRPPPASAASQI